MKPKTEYEMNLLKVNSAVWLHNYKTTGRHTYLNHAIAATKAALQIHAIARRASTNH